MDSVDKSSGSEVVSIDVNKSKDLLDSGYTYLDVRTVEEFKQGHVVAEKIVNIPFLFSLPEGRVKNEDFVTHVAAVFKETDDLVVGCLSGGRSLIATTELVEAGFKNVNNMKGGYQAWVENGFPVKVEETPKTEL